MSTFNRGEWSEIYAILSMLLCPELSIGNSELEEITKELYNLKKIKIYPNTGITEYELKDNGDVEVYFNNDFDNLIKQIELSKNKNTIFDAIKNAPVGNGSFEIGNINELLVKMTKGAPIKSRSMSKEDMEATVLDARLGVNKVLKYNIKSSLGSPATILNSSQNTNFLYEITGLDDKYIDEINSIDTRTKLLDRLDAIKKYGGQIKFVKVCSETFDYNLRMIDSNMPTYLGNALLESYLGDKDLANCFLKGNKFDDDTFALKKLADFMEGISFGFVPGTKWNGDNSVNGGLVIVKNDGSVMMLDLVYFRNEVLKYIMKETKFDSPSTSRYGMLNLYKLPLDDKIHFTLNIQLRYKK